MKVWCVEDDPVYAKFLEYGLRQNTNHNVTLFQSGKEFIQSFPEDVDVVTLDYRLPDVTCEQVIKQIKRLQPETNIVIISAQEDIATAVELVKKGAYDYIVKNEETKDRLRNVFNHLNEKIQLKEELSTLRQQINKQFDFSSRLKGKSPQMVEVFKLLEKASMTNITVSITGDTGTGKELAAKAIHFNSGLKNKPFVAMNLAAIPESLVESELFGHEKGAFTGADQRRIGKFEEANQGTLFLDEIAELDLSIQAKLLRVLQEKEFTRLGGSKSIKVDIRIIIASHKKLAEEVRNGNFREDLYYRLLGLPIHLPPLKSRGSDIILLAHYFVTQFCKENGMPVKKFGADASDKLLYYSWPGNVRELKAVVELACVMCSEEVIEAENINFNPTNESQDLLQRELSLKEYKSLIIKHYLEKSGQNVVEAAKKLDIGKSTIYRLIKSGEVKLDG